MPHQGFSRRNFARTGLYSSSLRFCDRLTFFSSVRLMSVFLTRFQVECFFTHGFFARSGV
jgi:hypothetical protein